MTDERKENKFLTERTSDDDWMFDVKLWTILPRHKRSNRGLQSTLYYQLQKVLMKK